MSTSRILRAWFAAAICALSIAVADARAQSGIRYWGYDGFDIARVPELPPGLVFVRIEAGYDHAVALRSDGSVVAWGNDALGQCDVPQLPVGLRYVDVQAGWGHTVALRSDGSVVAWGRNDYGQCDVPRLPPGLSYVEIAAGSQHTVARRSDGAIVGFGFDLYGQCDIPQPPPGVEYVEVAAGTSDTIVRMSDGSIVGFGDIDPPPPLPRGVTYVQIAASWDYAIARRSDGQVVGWSCSMFDQCSVPELPTGLTYTSIDAGMTDVIALRNDGSVVVWGHCLLGECDVPPLSSGLRYVEVSEGGSFSLGRYEGCATCELPFCLGDGGPRSEPCPCANAGAGGRGCENSASTGGARLLVHGSVDPDRVVLETSGTLPSSACVYFQGATVLESAQAFGDGARCIGGALERIAVRNASGGASSYPAPGDPSVSARSATLGDPIPHGTFRYYQVLYRDSSPSFCNPATFNASNAVMVAW